jgi:hypothetical protein
VADDHGGEPGGRIDGLADALAVDPGREIGAVEAVAGPGRVDRIAHPDRQRLDRLPAEAEMDGVVAVLDDHLLGAQPVQPVECCPRVRVAEQLRLVGEARQDDGRRPRRLGQHRPRVVAVRPEPRAVVGVEGDQRPLAPTLGQDRQECGPVLVGQDREADAGKVENVEAPERVEPCPPLAPGEHLARRGTAPPVEEAALARLVGADHVEPGQPPLEPRHAGTVEPLVLPALDHLVAERILAQGRDVGDRAGRRRQRPAQIDRGVQRVAAIALAHQARAGLAELDHAFADAGDPAHPSPSPCCHHLPAS